jgi:hypothetical protein
MGHGNFQIFFLKNLAVGALNVWLGAISRQHLFHDVRPEVVS